MLVLYTTDKEEQTLLAIPVILASVRHHAGIKDGPDLTSDHTDIFLAPTAEHLHLLSQQHLFLGRWVQVSALHLKP